MELREARTPFDSRLHPRDRLGRWRDVAHYLRSLSIPGLHSVGGSVRDEAMGRKPKDHDFIAIGQDHESIRELFEPHGRVDDLTVADRPVGIRLWPHDPAARALAPSGIEITPPRTERSTGPGHKDFEIVADASVPFAEDAKRRDFTVNAMAKALDTGELLDPLHGAKDAERKRLRTTSPTSFRDDPLRIVRGLRFVSELDLQPTKQTLEQMREYAAGVEHLSGERIKDQLDKLLMGDHPAKALRLARDTGVLAYMLPELAPTIGFEQQSKFHGLTADEHIFEVVQAAADAGDPLEVRLAALFHDSGKPESAWLGEDGKLHYYENAKLGKRAHEDIGAEKARSAMDRLGYSNPVRNATVGLVLAHMFQDHNLASARRARRFLAKHGPDRARGLLALKRADVGGKESDGDERVTDELHRVAEFEKLIADTVAGNHAYTRAKLRINGEDLLKLGFEQSPVIGAVIDALLGHVIGDPTLNDPDWLRAEAKRMLKKGVPTREREETGTAASRALYERTVGEGMSGGTEAPDARTDVQEREVALLNWMRMHSDARTGGFWPKYPGAYPGGMDQLIREHGRVFTKMGPSKADYDPNYTTPKECYYNALKVLMDLNPDDKLTYVEGVAFPPSIMPVQHAWLVDEKGFVHDPTWDHVGTVYAGIPFDSQFVYETVYEGGTTGVLDKIDYTEPLDPDVVVDYPLEPTVLEREAALDIQPFKVPDAAQMKDAVAGMSGGTVETPPASGPLEDSFESFERSHPGDGGTGYEGQAAHKAAMLLSAKKVAARLEGDPDFAALPNSVMLEVGDERDRLLDFGLPATENRVAAMLSLWLAGGGAGPSGGGGFLMSPLREAIAQEFGRPLDEPTHKTLQKRVYGNPWGYGDHAGHPGLRKFVRAVYEETQAELARLGVKELTLYRGQTSERAPAPVVRAGDSWTTSPDVANEYAEGLASVKYWGSTAEKPVGHVQKVTVPASEVFSTPLTGLGELGSREVLLIGGKPMAVEIVPRPTEGMSGGTAVAEPDLDTRDYAAHPPILDEPLPPGVRLHNMEGATFQERTTVALHLEDLRRIPQATRDLLHKAGVTWDVGVGGVASFPGLEHLAKVRPRGWSGGRTWKHVAAAFVIDENRVILGTGHGGSASMTVHETAHALAAVKRLYDKPELAAHHKRLYPKLSNYEKQASHGGRGGLGGQQELFAVGMDKLLSPGFDRDRVVAAYDEEFVSWLEGTLA